MLDEIKLLLGIEDNSKDSLINLLIENAIEDAILISEEDNIETMAKSTIERMVVFNYNRLGTEGLSSESYSGVSYNYSENYPDNILTALQKCKRKLKVLDV